MLRLGLSPDLSIYCKSLCKQGFKIHIQAPPNGKTVRRCFIYAVLSSGAAVKLPADMEEGE